MAVSGEADGLSAHKDTALEVSRQDVLKELDSQFEVKIEDLFRSLKAQADALKKEHPSVVGMSIPKTINDPLSGIACLLAQGAAQKHYIQEVLLNTVNLAYCM